MNVKATLETKISKKSGKEYIVLVIEFPNGYKKYVFPDNNAEAYLFQSFLV